MKFITEEDLRDLYRQQPFQQYDMQPGERLTPGARQFLLDRGIDMYDRNDPFISGFNKAQTHAETEKKPDPAEKTKFFARLKSVESEFLLAASQDVYLSGKMAAMYRQLHCILEMQDGCCSIPDFNFTACTGITEENCSESLDDCIEITDLHLQHPNGRALILLAKLRNVLREFQLDLTELLADEEFRKVVDNRINQIINSLSQLICVTLGGKECQRKM